MVAFLAIDSGSQSTKVSVVDASGSVHASAAVALRPYELGPGGRAVHPDDDLWDALTVSARETLASYDGSAGDVVAVGLCGIRFCRALLDAEGRLTEPVLSWMDARVADPVGPVDGVVTRRQVQVGQRVQAGSQLMSIVPVTEVYVDANFKEIQLRNVREGQLVTLTSDLYGSEVEFKGRVVGLSGGTGSAFALVPSQNATGNWIKVVQRLPVRIALDKAELEAHPLRIGLSMTVTIDTGTSH